MKAIFTPTSGIIRVFKADNAQYGDKYIGAVSCALYDHGAVCYIEGLTKNVTTQIKSAVFSELGRLGVRYVRWSHTNSRGHEVNVCCDLARGGKLKLE